MHIYNFSDPKDSHHNRNQLEDLIFYYMRNHNKEYQSAIRDSRSQTTLQNYQVDLKIRLGFLDYSAKQILTLLDNVLDDVKRYKKESISHLKELQETNDDLPESWISLSSFEMPADAIGCYRYDISTAVPEKIIEATILSEHLIITMKAYLELVQNSLALVFAGHPQIERHTKDVRCFASYLISLGVPDELLKVITIARNCIHQHAPLIEIRAYANGKIDFLSLYEKVHYQRTQFDTHKWLALPKNSPGLAIDLIEAAHSASYVGRQIPAMLTQDIIRTLQSSST